MVLFSLPDQKTAAHGHDIGKPVYFFAISEGKDKTVFQRFSDDRNSVEFSTFSPGVNKDRKNPDPRSTNVDEDLIGKMLVDYPYPVKNGLFVHHTLPLLNYLQTLMGAFQEHIWKYYLKIYSLTSTAAQKTNMVKP